MQMLNCHIAVAGDDQSIVVREHDSAVTFPELLILKALHGGENVREVTDAGDLPRDPDDERARLNSLYGSVIVKQVFPSEHDILPEFDPRMRRKHAAAVQTEDPPEELRDEKPAANVKTKR